MKVIRLLTCETPFEANLIKGRLENEGIRSCLANENFSSLMPNYNRIFGGGVQVMIFEKDYEKANEILALNEKVELICPNCGSTNIKISLGKNRIKMFFTILLSIFSAMPFNNINSVNHCKDCGTEFK